jgi:hypothetical protein
MSGKDWNQGAKYLKILRSGQRACEKKTTAPSCIYAYSEIHNIYRW